MGTPLADNLVLVMPRGATLRDWDRVGLLRREWLLSARLSTWFGRVIIVSYDRAIDAETRLAARQLFPTGAKVEFVHNLDGSPLPGFASLAAWKVGELVGTASAVIKTEQLTAGQIAIEIRDAIEARGGLATLLTRGGYLWSRFAAAEQGHESEAALSAARNEAALCREGDMIIGTTSTMVEDLCWRYRVDPQRAAVVPNFVVSPSRVPTAEERDRGLIVTAGHLVNRKRIGVLIEAMSLLDEELRSRATLEIIGDGPEVPRLERLVEALEVNARVLPVLPHSEMIEKLCRCAVYAQASEFEGHPKSVIDAMSCGAVVVLANAPGLDSLVKTGVTGILVPDPSPAGFANAFTGILGDPDWCNLLGSAAAEHARLTFSMDLVVELELAACTKAIANSAARRAKKAA